MDTMHAWALWRLVIVGLIALPFLVAAVVVGFRQSHVDGSILSSGPDDMSASAEISGPGAWRVASETRHPESHGNDGAPVVDKRAA